jgi:hypothetical protein
VQLYLPQILAEKKLKLNKILEYFQKSKYQMEYQCLFLPTMLAVRPVDFYQNLTWKFGMDKKLYLPVGIILKRSNLV